MPSKLSSNSKSTGQAKSGEYAIVETSGSQFWLETNRYYDLDRIDAELDQKLTLEKVLLINDGKKTTIGKPYIKNASVEVKVIAHRRGPKILVYKMRPKKKTRRKNGHRQELTRVIVQSISFGKSTKKVVSTTSAKTKSSPSKTKKTTTTSSSPSKKAKEEVK